MGIFYYICPCAVFDSINDIDTILVETNEYIIYNENNKYLVYDPKLLLEVPCVTIMTITEQKLLYLDPDIDTLEMRIKEIDLQFDTERLVTFKEYCNTLQKQIEYKQICSTTY